MSSMAETYLRQGRSFLRAGDASKALELLTKARALAAGNRQLLIAVLQEMVVAADGAGQMEHALRYREQLAALTDRGGLPKDPAGRLAGGRRGNSPRLLAVTLAAAAMVLLTIAIAVAGAWWMWHGARDEFAHPVAVSLPVLPVPPVVPATAPLVTPPPVAAAPLPPPVAEPVPDPLPPNVATAPPTLNDLGWDRQRLLKDNVGLVVVVLSYEGMSNGRIARMDLPFSLGTAFAVHTAGFLVTNRHVVDTSHGSEQPPPTLAAMNLPMMTLRDTSYLVCFGPTAGEHFQARVMYKGVEHDVALLKISRHFASPLVFARDAVRQGDDIVVCGYPGAVVEALNQVDSSKDHLKSIVRKWQATHFVDAMEVFSPEAFNSTLTRGIVSAAERNVRGVSYVQIDAVISGGNSGGPVLNTKNEVVGVATWGIRATNESTNSYNFAMSVDQLRAELATYLKDN